MPQASEKLRHEWVSDKVAIDYLEDQGFKLLPGFYWEAPNENHICSEKEKRAVLFLIEEWDFGGVTLCGCEKDGANVDG